MVVMEDAPEGVMAEEAIADGSDELGCASNHVPEGDGFIRLRVDFNGFAQEGHRSVVEEHTDPATHIVASDAEMFGGFLIGEVMAEDSTDHRQHELTTLQDFRVTDELVGQPQGSFLTVDEEFEVGAGFLGSLTKGVNGMEEKLEMIVTVVGDLGAIEGVLQRGVGDPRVAELPDARLYTLMVKESLEIMRPAVEALVNEVDMTGRELVVGVDEPTS